MVQYTVEVNSYTSTEHMASIWDGEDRIVGLGRSVLEALIDLYKRMIEFHDSFRLVVVEDGKVSQEFVYSAGLNDTHDTTIAYEQGRFDMIAHARARSFIGSMDEDELLEEQNKRIGLPPDPR